MDALNGGNKRGQNALFFLFSSVFITTLFLTLKEVLHINYD